MPGNTFTFAKQLTDTTGDAVLVHLNSLDGFATFAQLFTHGQLVRYSIQSANGDIESGVGTFNQLDNSLERTQVESVFLADSNTTLTVNPQRISLQYPAEVFGIISIVNLGTNQAYADAGMPVDESSLLQVLGSSQIGKGASLITIRNTPKLYTATTVEGALAEVYTNAKNAQTTADSAAATATNAETVATSAATQINDAAAKAQQAIDLAGSNQTEIATLSGQINGVVFVGQLQSQVSGQGASMIGIYDGGAKYQATNVEDALQEVMAVAKSNTGQVVTQLTNDLASTSSGKGASLIGMSSSQTVTSATNVEAAIEEIGQIARTNLSSVTTLQGQVNTANSNIAANATALNTKAASADLSSTAANKGASLIGIQDAGNLITATTVEGALQEVMTAANNAANSTALKTQLAGTTNGQGAQLVGLYQPDALIASNTVYGALREIAGNLNAANGNISTLTTNVSNVTTTTNNNTTNFNNFKSDLANITTAGKGAGLVGFRNPNGNYTTASTNVEKALSEVMNVAVGAQTGTGSLGSDLGNSTPGKGASLVALSSDNGVYTASTVEDALVEVRNLVNTNTSNISGLNTQTSSLVKKSELNSSGAGLGASLVGYVDTYAYYNALNLQGVLDSIATNQKANTNNIASNSQFLLDLGSTAALKGAAKVAVQAGGNFTSSTVQGALNEVYTAAHAHDNQVLPVPNVANALWMPRLNGAGTAYELMDAPTTRTNLGLGTMALQAASNYAALNQSNTWAAVQAIPRAVTTFTSGTNNVLVAQCGTIVCDASGGSIVLNLPAVGSSGGFDFQFVRKDTTSNSVTVQRQGSDTIDGSATSFALVAKNDQRHVVSDGNSNWNTVDMAQGNSLLTFQVANATSTNHAVAWGQVTATFAPLNSPVFQGTPTAPTAANGTSTDQIATTKFVQSATTGMLSATNPVLSGYGTMNATGAAGNNQYGWLVIGQTGAARDLLQVQQAGVSNGFTVQYNGSSMVYTFRDAPITHTAGSASVNALALTRTDGTPKTVTAYNNGARWQFSDGIDTAAVNINGNAVWHGGNFNPGNYALLTGATFTGLVSGTNFTASGNFNGPTLLVDNRATATTPGSYAQNAAWNFKQSAAVGLPGGSASSYCGVLGMAQWADDSGGGSHEMAFWQGNINGLYYRSGTRAAGWGSWYNIWHSGNFSPSSYATLNSPALSGTPTAPTPASTSNNTTIATTGFVWTTFAPLASPSFSGSPTAPNPSAGDNSTRIATTNFVANLFNGYAPLASPSFSGTPTAPNAAYGSNSSQIATTNYVLLAAGLRNNGSVTYAASVTLSATASNFYDIPLTGNITVNISTTGAIDAKAITVRFKQDATGSRTLTWGTGVGLGTDLASTTLSTGANKTDYVGLVYSAAAGKWHVVSFLRGY